MLITDNPASLSEDEINQTSEVNFDQTRQQEEIKCSMNDIYTEPNLNSSDGNDLIDTPIIPVNQVKIAGKTKLDKLKEVYKFYKTNKFGYAYIDPDTL